MTAPLKPCPFCGGDTIRSGHIRDGRFLGCVDCGAAISKFHPNADGLAITAWNTRADAPELLALVAALRKIADGNPTCDSPEADAQYGAAIARAALSAYEVLK